MACAGCWWHCRLKKIRRAVHPAHWPVAAQPNPTASPATHPHACSPSSACASAGAAGAGVVAAVGVAAVARATRLTMQRRRSMSVGRRLAAAAAVGGAVAAAGSSMAVRPSLARLSLLLAAHGERLLRVVNAHAACKCHLPATHLCAPAECLCARLRWPPALPWPSMPGSCLLQLMLRRRFTPASTALPSCLQRGPGVCGGGRRLPAPRL